MIGLVRHIEYLLLHNDDVFIPGLGRFTVLCDEAKIQSGGTSFLPQKLNLVDMYGIGVMLQ